VIVDLKKNKNLINVYSCLKHIAKVEMVEVVKRLEIIFGHTPRVRLTRLGLGLGLVLPWLAND